MATEDKRMLQLAGTSAEWAQDDISPSQDELAIERTSAGAVYAKIGDGITPFSALPRIVGWTEEELLTLFEAWLADKGTSTSTGATDKLKIVRLDSGGKLGASLFNPSLEAGTVVYRGGRNAVANGPPPTPAQGDLYRNGNTGTIEPDWAIENTNLLGVALVPGDFLIYTHIGWELM